MGQNLCRKADSFADGKEMSHFMESQVPVPNLEELATGFYPESAESSQSLSILILSLGLSIVSKVVSFLQIFEQSAVWFPGLSDTKIQPLYIWR